MRSARLLDLRRVRPAERWQGSYAENYERDPRASATARELATRSLQAWGWGPQDDVLLVVAELVSNAVRHAAGPGMRVTLTRLDDRRLRVAVIDRSHDRPRVLPEDPDGVRGRGMVLVDAVSLGWGVDVLPGGKRVWADLAVTA